MPGREARGRSLRSSAREEERAGGLSYKERKASGRTAKGKNAAGPELQIRRSGPEAQTRLRKRTLGKGLRFRPGGPGREPELQKFRTRLQKENSETGSRVLFCPGLCVFIRGLVRKPGPVDKRRMAKAAERFFAPRPRVPKTGRGQDAAAPFRMTKFPWSRSGERMPAVRSTDYAHVLYGTDRCARVC